MKPEKWDGNAWMDRCAWCEQEIEEEQEVIGVGLKFSPGRALPEWAGTIQPLRLSATERTVAMIVVTKNSPAKRDGRDAIFQVCSDACAKKLSDALRLEADLGEVIDWEEPGG